MNEIHLLTQDERELFFRTAADIQNVPFEIIEKDFWVVWILGRLFSLEKPRFSPYWARNEPREVCVSPIRNPLGFSHGEVQEEFALQDRRL